MGSGIPSPCPDCCLQGIGAQTCGFVFVHPLEHTQTKSSSLGVHCSPLEIISAWVKMLGINLGACFREQQRQTGQSTAPSWSMKPSSNSKNQSSHMQRILRCAVRTGKTSKNDKDKRGSPGKLETGETGDRRNVFLHFSSLINSKGTFRLSPWSSNTTAKPKRRAPPTRNSGGMLASRQTRTLLVPCPI